MKSKPCTKKCQPGCLVNRANHIPHEHFIMALSFLIIALSGLIITSTPAEAAKNPTRKKGTTITSCIDPDKRNIATRGTTALITIDTKNNTTNSVIKTDSCENSTSVREYVCSSGKITSAITTCPKKYTCLNGACVATTIPAVTSNVIIGTDGTWCNLRSSPDSIYFSPTSCEDSSGQKVASVCTSDRLSAYSCDYAFDGANYHHVQCKQYIQPCSWLNSQCSTNYCKPLASQTSTLPTSIFSCADTDNGTNADIAGTISIKNSLGALLTTASDSCLSDDTVNELSCDNQTWQRFTSSTISCESGICSDGACITLTSP